jgi:hypothetical protein
MAGSFAYTLTVTDTESQWTELRAVWNRGGFATTIRIQEIEKALPFAIKGVNTDNGSEFLNGHLIRYLKDRDTPVSQTRSRPYRKKYDHPMTPAQRILGSSEVSAETRKRINELMAYYDCYTLKCLVQEKLRAFFSRYADHAAAETKMITPITVPASSALRAAPSGTDAGTVMGVQRGKCREKVPA